METGLKITIIGQLSNLYIVGDSYVILEKIGKI